MIHQNNHTLRQSIFIALGIFGFHLAWLSTFLVTASVSLQNEGFAIVVLTVIHILGLIVIIRCKKVDAEQNKIENLALKTLGSIVTFDSSVISVISLLNGHYIPGICAISPAFLMSALNWAYYWKRLWRTVNRDEDENPEDHPNPVQEEGVQV